MCRFQASLLWRKFCDSSRWIDSTWLAFKSWDPKVATQTETRQSMLNRQYIKRWDCCVWHIIWSNPSSLQCDLNFYNLFKSFFKELGLENRWNWSAMEADFCCVSWTIAIRSFVNFLTYRFLFFSPLESSSALQLKRHPPQSGPLHLSICHYLYFDLIPLFRSVNIWFTISQINLYSTRHEHTCTLDTCTTQNNKVKHRKQPYQTRMTWHI